MIEPLPVDPPSWVDQLRWAPLLLVGIASLAALLGGLHYLCYILGWGRYQSPKGPNFSIPFVVADFFVKLINDFRHLLALLVFGLFAATLWRAIGPGLAQGNLEMMENGLKSVAAVLGPTVGLIIGYYFGESAGRRGTDEHPEHKPRSAKKPMVTQDPCDSGMIPAVGAPPMAANGDGDGDGTTCTADGACDAEGEATASAGDCDQAREGGEHGLER